MFVQDIHFSINCYIKPFTSGCQNLNVQSRRSSNTTAFHNSGVCFALGCVSGFLRSHNIRWLQIVESSSLQEPAKYLSINCPKTHKGHLKWAVDLVIQNWLTFFPEIVAAAQHVWGTSIYLEPNLISTFWEMGSKLPCQSKQIRTHNSFISWRFSWSLQFCIKRTHYS